MAYGAEFGEWCFQFPFAYVPAVDMFVEEDSAVHLGRGGGHASPASAREWNGVVGPTVGEAVASAVGVPKECIFTEGGVVMCHSEGP